MPQININSRPIGPNHPPFMIAEMSANHNGDIKNAFRLIEAAYASGADAVKMQTYRPDTITLDSDLPDFQITEGLWTGRTLYELYEEAHTPWEWHKPLFEHASELGITIFSSPFDPTAVDLLEDLNVPAYKVASFEAIDLPLIKYIAGTKKPMIISTGMACLEEIEEAVQAARDGGCKELAVLHCVSGYPAPTEDYNLNTLPDLSKRLGVVVGLSDHSIGSTTAIAAVALGASIVEKHFTLDRRGGGPDDSFSVEPDELTQLCSSLKATWESIGEIDYGRKSSELSNIQFRRSLYFVKDLKKGDVITKDAIRSVRPGYGLAPKYTNSLIGRILSSAVDKNTPTLPKHLEYDL
jgi:pseudaminic acid synthase